MNRSSDAFRRAAILIDSLDQQAADALMDQMPPEHAAQIRQAVMELDSVNVAERDEVLECFVQKDAGSGASSGGGKGDAKPIDDGIELDVSDSPAALKDFLARNPGLSTVAVLDGRLAGAALCGHDGRRGLLHHLAVRDDVGPADLVDVAAGIVVERGDEIGEHITDGDWLGAGLDPPGSCHHRQGQSFLRRWRS